RHQQALRQRVHRPGHRALDRPEEHQHAEAGREAAEQRTEREQQRRPDEGLHFAECARQESRQRQRNRIGHGERGDHPDRLVLTRAQVARDGRQRNVGDSQVQHLHEGRQRQPERRQRQAGGTEFTEGLGRAGSVRSHECFCGKSGREWPLWGLAGERREACERSEDAAIRLRSQKQMKEEIGIAAGRISCVARSPKIFGSRPVAAARQRDVTALLGAWVTGPLLARMILSINWSASALLRAYTSVLNTGCSTGCCDNAGPDWLCRFTSTSIDRPMRSGYLSRSFGSIEIRTGRRCTILIQLPDAFCAGSSENALPVPMPRPTTLPWYFTEPP